MLEFVESGGCAILLPDNSSFGGSGSDGANESLIDPFDMDIAGTRSGRVIATVTNPSSHSITSGLFGTFSTFSQNYPGGFTNVGQYATSLATNSLGDALAVIEAGEITSGSGGVVIYPDTNTYSGFFTENEGLFLNTIQFCYFA